MQANEKTYIFKQLEEDFKHQCPLTWDDLQTQQYLCFARLEFIVPLFQKSHLTLKILLQSIESKNSMEPIYQLLGLDSQTNWLNLKKFDYWLSLAVEYELLKVEKDAFQHKGQGEQEQNVIQQQKEVDVIKLKRFLSVIRQDENLKVRDEKESQLIVNECEIEHKNDLKTILKNDVTTQENQINLELRENQEKSDDNQKEQEDQVEEEVNQLLDDKEKDDDCEEESEDEDEEELIITEGQKACEVLKEKQLIQWSKEDIQRLVGKSKTFKELENLFEIHEIDGFALFVIIQTSKIKELENQLQISHEKAKLLRHFSMTVQSLRQLHILKIFKSLKIGKLNVQSSIENGFNIEQNSQQNHPSQFANSSSRRQTGGTTLLSELPEISQKVVLIAPTLDNIPKDFLDKGEISDNRVSVFANRHLLNFKNRSRLGSSQNFTPQPQQKQSNETCMDKKNPLEQMIQVEKQTLGTSLHFEKQSSNDAEKDHPKAASGTSGEGKINPKTKSLFLTTGPPFSSVQMTSSDNHSNIFKRYSYASVNEEDEEQLDIIGKGESEMLSKSSRKANQRWKKQVALSKTVSINNNNSSLCDSPSTRLANNNLGISGFGISTIQMAASQKLQGIEKDIKFVHNSSMNNPIQERFSEKERNIRIGSQPDLTNEREGMNVSEPAYQGKSEKVNLKESGRAMKDSKTQENKKQRFEAKLNEGGMKAGFSANLKDGIMSACFEAVVDDKAFSANFHVNFNTNQDFHLTFNTNQPQISTITFKMHNPNNINNQNINTSVINNNNNNNNMTISTAAQSQNINQKDILQYLQQTPSSVRELERDDRSQGMMFLTESSDFSLDTQKQLNNSIPQNPKQSVTRQDSPYHQQTHPNNINSSPSKSISLQSPPMQNLILQSQYNQNNQSIFSQNQQYQAGMAAVKQQQQSSDHNPYYVQALYPQQIQQPTQFYIQQPPNQLNPQLQQLSQPGSQINPQLQIQQSTAGNNLYFDVQLSSQNNIQPGYPAQQVINMNLLQNNIPQNQNNLQLNQTAQKLPQSQNQPQINNQFQQNQARNLFNQQQQQCNNPQESCSLPSLQLPQPYLSNIQPANSQPPAYSKTQGSSIPLQFMTSQQPVAAQSQQKINYVPTNPVQGLSIPPQYNPIQGTSLPPQYVPAMNPPKQQQQFTDFQQGQNNQQQQQYPLIQGTSIPAIYTNPQGTSIPAIYSITQGNSIPIQYNQPQGNSIYQFQTPQTIQQQPQKQQIQQGNSINFQQQGAPMDYAFSHQNPYLIAQQPYFTGQTPQFFNQQELPSQQQQQSQEGGGMILKLPDIFLKNTIKNQQTNNSPTSRDKNTTHNNMNDHNNPDSLSSTIISKQELKSQKLSKCTYNLPFDPFSFQTMPTIQIEIKGKNTEQEKILHTSHSQGITIGRSTDNSVVFSDDPSISSYHALIFHLKNEFFLQDIKSKAGTFIKINSIPLTQDLKLKLGEVEFKVTKIEKGVVSFVSNSTTTKKGSIDVGKLKQVKIGRCKLRCDVVLQDTNNTVSYVHAKFHFDDENKLMISDLGSGNGTWLRLSDRGIKSQPYKLALNDEIMISNSKKIIVSQISS